MGQSGQPGFLPMVIFMPPEARTGPSNCGRHAKSSMGFGNNLDIIFWSLVQSDRWGGLKGSRTREFMGNYMIAIREMSMQVCACLLHLIVA